MRFAIRFLTAAVLAMVLSCVLGNTARADDSGLNWAGAQILLPVSGELKLAEQVGLRGHVVTFFVPTGGVFQNFFYAGPTFLPVASEKFELWVSPQFVCAANWFGPGDGIGPSLWLNLNFAGKLGLFLEGEVYFAAADGTPSYYGYYALDAFPLDWLNAGAQVEQADRSVIFGPHIGAGKDHFSFEIQWYLIPGDAWFHTTRFVTGIKF